MIDYETYRANSKPPIAIEPVPSTLQQRQAKRWKAWSILTLLSGPVIQISFEHRWFFVTVMTFLVIIANGSRNLLLGTDGDGEPR